MTVRQIRKPDVVAAASDRVVNLVVDLAQRAQIVREDEDRIGVYSTGEAIAVALILNRPDLLPRGYTLLQAIDRLGDDWTRAAILAQAQI